MKCSHTFHSRGVCPSVLAFVGLLGGIDTDIEPVTFDRLFEDDPHLAVDLIAEPVHLALGDAAHHQRFDQLVDQSGRYPLHPRLKLDGRL